MKTPAELAKDFYEGSIEAMTCPDVSPSEMIGVMEYRIAERITQEKERAKAIYRSLHSGGCRMLSEGDKCQCFLCQIERE